MLSRIKTATLKGIDARIISVEVDISDGLPGWHMVGLPEQVVKESKDRVWAALRNSGYGLPAQKITVNFSPADHKKSGTGFDLPVAVGLLSASNFIGRNSGEDYLFVAELSLTGKLLPVNGILAMAVAAKRHHFRGMVVPEASMQEAVLVTGLDIVGCEDLPAVIAFLNDGARPIHTPGVCMGPASPTSGADRVYDLADVKGQYVAKRALEIAAAGNHNLLMLGPPGTGKTMLAERLPSIMPPLSEDEALETTKIYSAMGLIDPGSPLMMERPFRAPHHSASYAGLFGGGSGLPTIGEISLSHNGVLFLDELPEFRKDVIEVLRQPLEAGYVRITRAGYAVRFPARFLLTAAMNPCRCGFYGHPVRSCICSVLQIQSYRRKLSGPLLDRIDLRVEVPALKVEEMITEEGAEPSVEVRRRVVKARKRQGERFKGHRIGNNSRISPAQIRELCPLDPESKKLLRLTMESKGYSARGLDRIIRVARTIADLDDSKDIRLPHIAEAIQHHRLDRLQDVC